MNRYTRKDLKKLQAEKLPDKFQRSLGQVAAWFSRWDDQVYVSFSGGKDSTVLADICAKWCKSLGIPLHLVFSNTGLEFPEIREHVERFAAFLREKHGIDVVLEILRPEMRFDQVIKNYGYPLISKDVSDRVRKARNNIEKGVYSLRLCQLGVGRDEYGGLVDKGSHDYEKAVSGSKFYTPKWRPLLDADFRVTEQCCEVMKKKPFKEYEERTGRKPIIGTLATESLSRANSWYKHGCNAVYAQRPSSRPLSFWTEQDILQYIKQEGLPLASVYGDVIIDDQKGSKLKTTGCDRTGCMFCAFGCTQEDEPRFERLKKTHPRQWRYCINGGEYNSSGVWQPNKQGLGMGHVFDELNAIYGDDFIKYGKETEIEPWMQ